MPGKPRKTNRKRVLAEPLREWMEHPRTSVSASQLDFDESRIAEAAINSEIMRISYQGWESPAQVRIIIPKRLYQRNGNIYVEAYCTLKGVTLSFRTDRITILQNIEAVKTPLVKQASIIAPPSRSTMQHSSTAPKIMNSVNYTTVSKSKNGSCLVLVLLVPSVLIIILRTILTFVA